MQVPAMTHLFSMSMHTTEGQGCFGIIGVDMGAQRGHSLQGKGMQQLTSLAGACNRFKARIASASSGSTGERWVGSAAAWASLPKAPGGRGRTRDRFLPPSLSSQSFTTASPLLRQHIHHASVLPVGPSQPSLMKAALSLHQHTCHARGHMFSQALRKRLSTGVDMDKGMRECCLLVR